MKKKLPDRVERKAYFFIIILIVILGLLLTASISITLKKPIGSDFWFHLEIAKAYARGENALFEERFMKPNMGPYPPLFHLFLVPFVILGIAVQFSSVLQVIFYPLALSTSIFLVYRKIGLGAAAFTSVMLFSSVAFFDRSVQVIPQALDMIFFPMAVYFFLENRRLPFICSMSVMIYSHGVFGILLLVPLLIYSLKFKTDIRMLRDVLVVVSPIIVLTAVFFPFYLASASGGVQNPQEMYIAANPLFALLYIGLVPSTIFIFSVMYKISSDLKLDRMDVLLLVWFAALIPMILPYPDRFCTYAVVPMSIFSSKFLAEKLSFRKKYLVLVLLTILFIFSLQSYFNWWGILMKQGVYLFDAR